MSEVTRSSISTGTGTDGVAAPNPVEVTFVGQVAPLPAGDSRYNTVKEQLQVVGCCTLPDECFDFDSSFIVPGAREEFVKLHKLRGDLADAKATDDDLRDPPLTIFGHTDPVSDPLYNLLLSRRRAAATYSLLIRNIDTWETLADKPQGNDKWDVPQYNTMLVKLGDEPIEQKSDLSKEKRRELFGRYMDALCQRREGSGFVSYKLSPSRDFLCRGSGENSRGDLQGCGEYNPQFILSKENEDRLTKEERNAANRRNRRVITYLFKPGSRLDPAHWPCPFVDLTRGEYAWENQEKQKECQKRFWYSTTTEPHERNKKDPKKDREFSDNYDTFACRFYQGVSRNSPCENALKLWVIQILGTTPRMPVDPATAPDEGRRVVNQVRFVVKAGDDPAAPLIRGKTDDRGYIRIPVFDAVSDMELRIDVHRIAAGNPDADDPDKLEELEKKFPRFFLRCGTLRHLKSGALPPGAGSEPPDQREAVKQRLYNLGYGPADFHAWTDDDLDKAIIQLQKDNDLPDQSGTLDDNTLTCLKLIHEPIRVL